MSGHKETLEKQYQAKQDRYFSYDRSEMLPFVPSGARRILEIGCGEGGFGSMLRQQRGIQVVGIEPVEAAARVAEQRLDQVWQMNIEEGIRHLADDRFDCIVCNDVLEHLLDPWEVLRGLRPLIVPGGVIVASIPNIRYMPVLKEFVLEGLWRYQERGVMDKTHLRFFTKRSMGELFELSGYALQHIEGINGLRFPWKFGLMNALFGGAFDDARFMQFACVAIPKPLV